MPRQTGQVTRQLACSDWQQRPNVLRASATANTGTLIHLNMAQLQASSHRLPVSHMETACVHIDRFSFYFHQWLFLNGESFNVLCAKRTPDLISFLQRPIFPPPASVIALESFAETGLHWQALKVWTFFPPKKFDFHNPHFSKCQCAWFTSYHLEWKSDNSCISITPWNAYKLQIKTDT